MSVFYDATTLAAGAFQKACNMVDVDPASFTDQLQVNGTWYDVFDVDPEEVTGAYDDFDIFAMMLKNALFLQRP